jgi:myo-inositol catabolism protein IolC
MAAARCARYSPEVHGVGFSQEAEVDALLKAARQQGSEPLLEVFGCRMVALAQGEAEQSLRQAGVARVAGSKEEALGYLLERFSGNLP